MAPVQDPKKIGPKKVPVPVLEKVSPGKITGTGNNSGYRHTKVMREKVFLYRFSGMLFLVCDIENTGIFCSNLAFCNASFSLI